MSAPPPDAVPPPRLPESLAPMLARLGEPFDSPQHRFEVKWDGFRALAFVERGRLRLLSRNGGDLLPRFAELAPLGQLEDGCILDGEVVILVDGRPAFHKLLERERSGRRRAAPDEVASYVAFDLLYRDYAPRLARPLEARLAELAEVLRPHESPRLQSCPGVVGKGRAFFEQACALRLEGVVGKRLDSPYLPGKRTDAWVKVKRTREILCLVVGFEPSGPRDFKSLHVAAEQDGTLAYVGRVGTGFGDDQRAAILARLAARPRATPVVPVPEPGRWVEPFLYCLVSYAELTPAGLLRAPVFVRLVEGAEGAGPG